MMLDKKEIIKLILYDIKKEDHKTLEESYEKSEEKEIFPKFDDLLEYLFSWDNVSEKNNEKLIEYLKGKYNLNWLNKATIKKIAGNEIRLAATEKNAISLILDAEKSKVNLITDDGKTDEFIARCENGELKIYNLKIRDKYQADDRLISLDEAPEDQNNWKALKKQIKDTNYDLRLGKQYLLREKVYELDPDKKPILKIPPHDVVVVLTYETITIPKKLVGNFSLNLGFVLKGLMLANGSQVSPGYKGKLACVLFNLTNKPILLKYKDSFAKISFFELTGPASYKGDHQEYKKIQDFIKDSMPTSGLADINTKIEDYHKDLEKHKKDIEDKIRNAIILILAVISGILTMYKIFGGG